MSAPDTREVILEARELTRESIEEALVAGRAFVAFDWIADARGFDCHITDGSRRADGNSSAYMHLRDGGDLVVNTVADGIYHLGCDIERFAFQNEDGNRNAELEDVAHWLTLLLRQDLANGTLSSQGDSGNQAVPQPTAAAQAADAVFAELGS